MKKCATRFLALTLALMCALTTLCLGTSATEISPRYTGISLLDANIDISSSRFNYRSYILHNRTLGYR